MSYFSRNPNPALITVFLLVWIVVGVLEILSRVGVWG
jgi:hypothetical protein